MSDPNDVWQDSAPAGDRERSPRRERERSRSPAPRNGDREPRDDGRGEDRGRGGERDAPPVNQGNNLHVSGLAKSVDIRMLEEVFGRIGKIYKAEIMNDPHTQESRGFGFVKYDSADDAAACIEQLNGTELEGKTITVAIAKRGRARTPTPGQYHGYKLEDRRPYGGGPGGGYRGGYGGGGGYGGDRPYQPRSYDSRYDSRGPPRYDDRRYDDRRDDRPRYDDRRDDRPRYDDRRDERPRYDDRPPRFDDRREPRRDDRPRYDERPSTGGAAA